MPKMRFAILGLLIGALVAAPTPVSAQLGGLKKKIEQKAERAVDREVDQALDKTENEIRCTVGDSECIQKAEKDGKKVVIVDQDGEVVKSAAVAEVPPAKPGEGVWANYDFVPGEKILFTDDFSQDRVGDFPKRLEWLRGNMEIVEWQGRRLLRANGHNSQFAILVPGGVPERFTLEFSVHDPANAAGTTIVPTTVPDNGHYRGDRFNFGSWRGSGIWREGEPLSTVVDERISNQVVTARIMVDGAHAKVFLNEKRVANAPRINLNRGDRITFVMLDARNDRPVYLGDIRLAAGGRDLYDVLETEGRVSTQGIMFDTGSDAIRPESTPTLEEMGEMLKAHSDLRIAIVGHTDSVGDDASNQSLSERRAVSVRQYLIETYGIDAGRLEHRGMGEGEPVADNDTPEGRQQNRRVELIKL